MAIRSFFLPRNPRTTESKHRDKGLNKTARTAAEKFLQVFTPFFKNLSQIFDKMRFPSLQAAEGEIRSFMVGAERELPEQDSTKVP